MPSLLQVGFGDVSGLVTLPSRDEELGSNAIKIEDYDDHDDGNEAPTWTNNPDNSDSEDEKNNSDNGNN